MYIQVRLHKQDGDRNAAVSAGQSSRCTLMLKRPHIRLDIQRYGEYQNGRVVDCGEKWEPQGEKAATR
ncbi:hypothetical protein T03_16513 [Trichinella britovi]|uniref:Uncharacterized protein n=1 Tax=Trichinella britovi TaxID=45882 RepID=A0A0V1AJK2_TRIBR|nr:hypothetical protein T03_16513 [Trichinella britovi]